MRAESRLVNPPSLRSRFLQLPHVPLTEAATHSGEGRPWQRDHGPGDPSGSPEKPLAVGGLARRATTSRWKPISAERSGPPPPGPPAAGLPFPACPAAPPPQRPPARAHARREALATWTAGGGRGARACAGRGAAAAAAGEGSGPGPPGCRARRATGAAVPAASCLCGIAEGAPLRG